MRPVSQSNVRANRDSITQAWRQGKGRPSPPEELTVSEFDEGSSLASGLPFSVEGHGEHGGPPRLPNGVRPLSPLRPLSAISRGLDERRPGTGRFYSDELSCFKRVPSPSALCGHKAELYAQTAGGMSRYLSDSCLPTAAFGSKAFHIWRRESMETMGSADYAASSELSPSKAQAGPPAKLPEEERTATILEKIYPRSPSSPSHEDTAKAMPSLRPGTGNARPSTVGHGGLGESRRRYAEDIKNQRISAHQKFVTFRQKVLDRFSTMRVAFDSFAASLGSTKELPRKEFSKFLNKHFPGLSREEHEQIFDFLDSDKNGNVSVQEFTYAVEAATPVRTIEDLRRKWIALGFHSMRQVINQMDKLREQDRFKQHSSGRLTLPEFGALLSKVGICDEEEHSSIFAAISDPNFPAESVSLTELAAALAAVSPSLLLEDIQDRLTKRYGSVMAAYRVIDVNANISLNYGEFAQYAVHHWRMTPYEAQKAFRLIDFDGSHGISPLEFGSALKLSEPTLFSEVIRRKVRQRFFSIREALKAYYPLAAPDDSPGGGGGGGDSEGSKGGGGGGGASRRSRRPMTWDKTATEEHIGLPSRKQDFSMKLKSAKELAEVLADVQLPEQDTNALYSLVDINNDGTVTAVEFARGMRLFAPSCVLENLRLKCMENHKRVSDVFAGLSPERRSKVMDAHQMRVLLEELGLASGVKVEAIMDLMEPHRTGGMSVRELIAALQSTGPGGVVALPPEERDARAKQSIRWQMAPFHRSATEFRTHVRHPLHVEVDEHEEEEVETVAAKIASNERRSAAMPRPTTTPLNPLRKKEIQSKSRGPPTGAEQPLMKQSYSKVSRFLRGVMEPDDSKHILDNLHGYYSSAGSKVANDSQLLSAQQSRWQHFKNSSGHYKVLARSSHV